MVVVYRHWFLCVFCVLWSVVVGGGGVACRNMTTENSPFYWNSVEAESLSPAISLPRGSRPMSGNKPIAKSHRLCRFQLRRSDISASKLHAM